jgi:hypothetical protein
MRISRHAALAIVLLAPASGALTQPPPVMSASAPPQGDIYSDNKSTRFSHWSGVVDLPNRLHSLRYSVCNLNASDDLYFRWDKPGFSTGWTHALPVGTCGTNALDATSLILDTDAPITFAQNNQIKSASAYLPASGPLAPSSSTLQTFTRGPSVPTIVEFTVTLLPRSDGEVIYSIRWSQGIPSLAFSMELPEEMRKKVLADLERAGVKARFAAAKELVADSDLAHLSGRAREANYLSFAPEPGAPPFVRFSYAPPARETRLMPMLALDNDRRVIAAAQYNSVR